jgi:hypothetical protein
MVACEAANKSISCSTTPGVQRGVQLHRSLAGSQCRRVAGPWAAQRTHPHLWFRLALVLVPPHHKVQEVGHVALKDCVLGLGGERLREQSTSEGKVQAHQICEELVQVLMGVQLIPGACGASLLSTQYTWMPTVTGVREAVLLWHPLSAVRLHPDIYICCKMKSD